MKRVVFLLCAGLVALAAPRASARESPALGLFEDHADIGEVKKAGSVRYDAAAGKYFLAGGGDNMWFAKDALHFVWTQMLGDMALSADIQWPTAGGNPHRKAVLMIRQTLDPDSAYADAVLHGSGLTSLQYREVRGGPTREIQANVSAPRRLKITKEGDYVFLQVAREGESLKPSGGSFRIQLRDPFMVGLGVCAHDHASLETAVFSKVEITSGRATSPSRAVLESTLETVAIASKDRRVVRTARGRLAAPTWSADGKVLFFDQVAESGVRVLTLPASGAALPRSASRPVARAPSRDSPRLVSSDRDGTMQVWRTNANGIGKVALTADPFGNCFPQASPDGKWLLVVSYEKGVRGCPPNQDVTLRLIPLGGAGEIQVLAKLFGGRGTIDRPPWSPDSTQVAFVSYRFTAP